MNKRRISEVEHSTFIHLVTAASIGLKNEAYTFYKKLFIFFSSIGTAYSALFNTRRCKHFFYFYNQLFIVFSKKVIRNAFVVRTFIETTCLLDYEELIKIIVLLCKVNL